MNILFLTQILPFPPDAGPKVKTWHVLRALKSFGHSVTLVSFVRPEEVRHILNLKGICDNVHTIPIRRSRISDVGYLIRSYFTGRPFLIERDDLRPMQELVNKLVDDNEFHFIHADQLTMVQFAIRGASAFPNKELGVIFDAHNAVWTIVERMKENALFLLKPILAMEAKRIRKYEGELLRTVDHVLAVTEIDKKLLEEAVHYSDLSPNDNVSPITVVPIAVDTGTLKPIHRKAGSKNIVTLGTLHYPPNADGIRWFFNEVFPLVLNRVPDATLTVIGKNPPQDFLETAKNSLGKIIVTGYVDTLVPFLEDSVMMVVPVRAGGGMRVRILEAFAYSMPVVTTTVGLEGIQATPNQEVLIADSPADFANATIRLLEDDVLQEKISQNGRILAETKYDWKVVLKLMGTIYK